MLSGIVVHSVEEIVGKQWSEKHGSRDITNVSAAIDTLALEVVCQAAFGMNSVSTILLNYKSIMNASLLKMIGLGRFGGNRILVRASAAIDKVVQEVLQNRPQNLASPEHPAGSLIDLLLSSNMPGDAASDQELDPALSTSASSVHMALSDREIIDNIKIFMFAGHDTSTTTMIWVLFMLALHPQAESRVLAEITTSLQGRTMRELPAHELSWKFFPYLHCVVQETLRLFPPAWTINRSPKYPISLGGFTVPAGMTIMINTLRLHRREDLGWQHPTEFIPERWEVREPHHAKSAFCYLPFGGGPRSCVGQNLAELEILVATCAVLTRYQPIWLGKSSSPQINFFAGSTIRPKDIGSLRLRPRLLI